MQTNESFTHTTRACVWRPCSDTHQYERKNGATINARYEFLNKDDENTGINRHLAHASEYKNGINNKNTGTQRNDSTQRILIETTETIRRCNDNSIVASSFVTTSLRSRRRASKQFSLRLVECSVSRWI